MTVPTPSPWDFPAVSGTAPRGTPSPVAPTGTGWPPSPVAQQRARRKRAGAAGVEQHDHHRRLLVQPRDQRRQRHQPRVGGVQARRIGVDRQQVVLAARLDAVAGIVEQRHVGALGVVDEAFEVTFEMTGVAVFGEIGLEAQPVEHGFHGAGVARRVGEVGQAVVVGVADDQRHAAQLLAGLRGVGGKAGREKEEEGEGGCQRRGGGGSPLPGRLLVRAHRRFCASRAFPCVTLAACYGNFRSARTGRAAGAARFRFGTDGRATR